MRSSHLEDPQPCAGAFGCPPSIFQKVVPLAPRRFFPPRFSPVVLLYYPPLLFLLREESAPPHLESLSTILASPSFMDFRARTFRVTLATISSFTIRPFYGDEMFVPDDPSSLTFVLIGFFWYGQGSVNLWRYIPGA